MYSRIRRINLFGVVVHVGFLHVGFLHVGFLHVGFLHVGFIHVGFLHVGLISFTLNYFVDDKKSVYWFPYKNDRFWFTDFYLVCILVLERLICLVWLYMWGSFMRNSFMWDSFMWDSLMRVYFMWDSFTWDSFMWDSSMWDWYPLHWIILSTTKKVCIDFHIKMIDFDLQIFISYVFSY